MNFKAWTWPEQAVGIRWVCYKIWSVLEIPPVWWKTLPLAVLIQTLNDAVVGENCFCCLRRTDMLLDTEVVDADWPPPRLAEEITPHPVPVDWLSVDVRLKYGTHGTQNNATHYTAIVSILYTKPSWKLAQRTLVCCHCWNLLTQINSDFQFISLQLPQDVQYASFTNLSQRSHQGNIVLVSIEGIVARHSWL